MRFCVWCEAFVCANGDIYCEGCRSSVVTLKERGDWNIHDEYVSNFYRDDWED